MNLKYFVRKPFQIFVVIISRFPKFKFLRDLSFTEEPITFNIWWKQKVLGYNRKAYWPMHFSSKVVGVENIYVGIGSNPGINHGTYIQGSGKLYIGNYCIFGPNVGIMSGNHDFYDNRKSISTLTTRLGNYCWVGMNSVILPGIELGNYTIVAAGSVVTKSFSDGYCVIGGNPAKKLKDLEPEKCLSYSNKHEYHGYIPKHKFEKFRKKYLNV
jgi:acetyltransferase-like isoleucine patch superfamily enzyme